MKHEAPGADEFMCVCLPFFKILSLHIVSEKFLEFLQFQAHLLLERLQEASLVGAPGRREKSDRLVDGWATSAK